MSRILCTDCLRRLSSVKYKPVYKDNPKAYDQQKIEIDASAHKHGRDQISSRKYMNKHRLIHKLRDALRSGQREHIHRNIHCSLEKDHFHGTGSLKAESQIDHISQYEHAASLQERHEEYDKQAPLVSFKPCNSLLVAVNKSIDLLLSLVRRLPYLKPDEKSLKEQRCLSDILWEQHNAKYQDYKDYIERQPQKIQEKIISQFLPEGIEPE